MQSLTIVVKMVGKSVIKEEIRAYMKACFEIGCSLKQIFAEISGIYRSTNVSWHLHRWIKKIDSVLESKENAPKSGRPKSASCNEIVSKV